MMESSSKDVCDFTLTVLDETYVDIGQLHIGDGIGCGGGAISLLKSLSLPACMPSITIPTIAKYSVLYLFYFDDKLVIHMHDNDS